MVNANFRSSWDASMSIWILDQMQYMHTLLLKGVTPSCLNHEVNCSSRISESLVAGFCDHVGGQWLRGFAPSSKVLSLFVSGNT